ncbi:class II aldolase/adducin family protein [Rhodococcus coprophilus]|uniref:Aldolase II superfamily protein n=1 Tax=Rhodococcus coprophilus TaxID=38310 RepID=A0A2X4UAN3_9NOCA|nr:class II aldolase/adducin family protein [Rhodococcus coprophilus]MBM7457513.1 ribulose-5-phosphate 4-epimerase/fuculose-1-phosphate aldolase [Rhodococcus coprophilus]SQI29870.1 aldolase II superfamily protein [Rhodococcus coprophilus]
MTVLDIESAEEQRLRRDLAAVYRLVAHFGMTDLIFTHISLRLPGPEPRFLINPYGLLFEEITASNLVVVDPSGQPIGDTGAVVNPAGFVIHSAVHTARPDAHCVMHTHTRAGCAVAATTDGLLPVNQMSMEFYNRVGYHDYEGVALSFDEQARLVADLGDHPVMILRNHGLLTVGSTAAQAFLRMFYLNRACEIQVTAAAAGPLILPPPNVCERSARQLTGTNTGDDFADPGADLAWAALLRLVDRIAPGYAD